MKAVLLATCAMSALAGVASADVVLDGGFESPINAANGWTTNSGFTQVTNLGTTILPHTGTFFTGATSSSNAARTNTLAQVLSLNPGEVVDFSIWYTLVSTSTSAALSISLDGNVIFSSTPGATNVLTWTQIPVSNITITNANPTLSITQTITGRTNSFYFDDVSVTVQPAPAPTSAMLGLGVLGLASRRRR